MRFKYLLYILFFTLTLFVKQAAAQGMSNIDYPNFKVSNYTDEQLTAAWKKFQDSGLSEEEAYKMLLQKGVPPDQISALKDKVTQLGLNKKKTVNLMPEKPKVDFSREKNDSVLKPLIVKPQPNMQSGDLQVYGTAFFNQVNIRFEPNFSVATPKSYVLGPGDEVIVLLNGLNESVQRIKVSPDGTLNIEHAGIVYVNGFTIEQVTALVKTKMIRAYPAISSGQTQLTINLGNTRSIKITIVGEVKAPGAYTTSALSTLFNLLYNSGGPNANGSLRNIELIRNNKVYKTVDFYNFLQKGVLDGNIRLEDQDVIHIPVYKKRVSIGGEVKTPAIFELKDNESLEDLINYAGGFTDIAYKGIAKIDQINLLQHEVKDVPANTFANYIPHNGDLVQIGAITNRYTNRIVLEGAVYRPGVYELTSGFTLGQLLKSAQGLKPEAYMERGYIKRTLPNLEKDIISFKPSDIITGRNDIPLLREDSVMIMNRDAFTPDQKVRIEGYVRKPSVFTYRKGLKLADVIAMAGGFAEEAADHHVEISRIIPNQSDTVANKLVQTFVVNLDSLTGSKQDIDLSPMDIIFVPRLVNYRPIGNVSVQGEVVFPGDYAVQRRDESALDFLKRAGGVTPYGSLVNAQVYRKGIRVNIDLTEATLHDSTSNRHMILLPRDSIYVPRVISYVEVAGAVNNPQYISYNGHRFKYYINAAGGTTENARLKGAYIKYPDGLNKPVRHFLLFRNYPEVKPGSKIIVPAKSPDSRIRLSIGDMSGIATALTAIVSIFVLLRN
jgi:protein involved in polysaccharide export with SLBB domain